MELNSTDDETYLKVTELLSTFPQSQNFSSDNTSGPQNLFEDITEVVWWVNRALILPKKYRGQCTRKMKMQNENQVNYY